MRLYRTLLRLYPSSFWAEYRDELCHAFAERTRELSGPLASVMILLAAITDVIPNAIAAHWDVLRQDLGYAARSLRRTPGFALTAVLVVALGVGANTAVFSLADFVLLRPLPYRDADRLVKLWENTPGYETMEPSPANYRDWKAMTASFSTMGAYASWEVNLVGAGEPRRIEILAATQEVLPMLGAAPLVGRTFTAQDEENVLLLSHALWQSQLGGDPGIVGTTVRVDGTPHTVLGVMPASFQFPSRSVQAWRPLVFDEDAYTERNNNYLEVLARLRPGVSKEQAREELAVVSTRLERQYPKENKDVGAAVLGLRDDLSDRSRLPPRIVSRQAAGRRRHSWPVVSTEFGRQDFQIRVACATEAGGPEPVERAGLTLRERVHLLSDAAATAGRVAGRLPRDFMKLGQLMLDGGTWQGRRILSRDFVARASAPLYRLRNIDYGYLWWGIDYPYKDRTVHAFFAAGAGGQTVMVVPELDLVIATYGGNYSSKGSIHTSQNLAPRYILPAVREPGDDKSAPVIPREDYVTPYGRPASDSAPR